MRLTIHIGTPKTASTSIQRFMTANHDALLEKSGVLYPETGRKTYAHHGFAVELEESARSRRYSLRPSSAELRDEARRKGAGRVLISSEWMTFANQLDRVGEVFDGFEVDVVVLLRRQDQFVESYYREMLKRHSFPNDVRDFTNTKRVRDVIHYRDLIERWLEALQIDEKALTVIPFEPSVLREPIEDVFLRAVGMDPDEAYRRLRRANESLSRASLELLRLARTSGDGTRIEVTPRLLSGLAAYTAEHPDLPQHKYFMSPAERSELLGSFSDVNVWVAQRFLGRDRLFVTSPADETGLWEPFPGLELEEAVAIAASIADRRDQVDRLRKQLKRTRQQLESARSTIATQQSKLDAVKRLLPAPIERLARRVVDRNRSRWRLSWRPDE